MMEVWHHDKEISAAKRTLLDLDGFVRKALRRPYMASRRYRSLLQELEAECRELENRLGSSGR